MSKYQSYDDYRAVCPYYRGARANELVCEGACEGARTMVVRFGQIRQLRVHRSRHCDNLKGYERCPLYRAHTPE